MLLLRFACALTFLLCSTASCFADDNSFASTNEGQNVTSKVVVLGFRERVALHWQSVLTAIKDKDLKRVNSDVTALETLRMEAGVEGFEDYSLGLIKFSEGRLNDGNIEDAAFFLRKALQLSPNSSRVLLSAMPIARATHTGAAVEMFLHGIARAWSEPAMLFAIGKKLMYPVAWALTIGVYLSMLFVFCGSMREFLRAVALVFLRECEDI